MSEEQVNKFKELCKGETQQTIIKFINDFINKKPSDQDLKTFADFITQSNEIYIDYIVFVDCFNRQSKSFRLMSKWHIFLKDNHSKYSQYFKRITKKDKELNQIMKKKEGDSIKSISDVDSLILTEGE